MQIVGHVQDHQGRQAEARIGRRQHQVPLQVGRVENQQHRVGRIYTRHQTLQDVVRDALVFGAGFQAVDAGQIDDEDVSPALDLHAPYALLDRNAREVGYLLAQAGEAVEQGGFAGVRRTYQGHGVPRLEG